MNKHFTTQELSKIDPEHTFFHYTSKQNLDSILENGLEPRIGANSLHVEKTPKIFFVEGENGILAIIDVWLKWLTAKIDTGKLKYWFGTKIYMRIPFCIKSIPDNKVRKSLSSNHKRQRAYEQMKEILNNSVFLILALEEGVDFSRNDIDEVKATYYESFLKLLYPNDSNLGDHRMEYWNMHTYSNKTISPQKIILLKHRNTYNANHILMHIIEKDIDYTRTNYQFLYKYYLYLKGTL